MDETEAILLVEDDPRDIELALDLFAESGVANRIVVARDGEEALEYLCRRGRFVERPPGAPLLVLLDLNLPRLSGLEVLREMKSNDDLDGIPVVVVTSSRNDRDLSECRYLAADSIVEKPLDLQTIVELAPKLGLTWTLGRAEGPR
jgi:CheY-like chemotaxis protein